MRRKMGGERKKKAKKDGRRKQRDGSLEYIDKPQLADPTIMVTTRLKCAAQQCRVCSDRTLRFLPKWDDVATTFS
jgi:hypothetical protein